MSPTLSPSPFGTAKTLVLKVGSAVLTNAEGDLDKAMLHTIADWTSNRMDAGCNVILVTSGAVAAGRSALGLRDRNLTISQKQALAAVGQSRLMQMYAELFANHGYHVGQMLLTAGDMEDRRRYVNARYTLEELLRRRCIPIINENDTVTVDELKFGDNDGLAARVAVKMQADALVLLSDVDGVYSANPKTNPDAHLIEIIEKVTPALIEQLCPTYQTGSLVGSGGMLSKLRAARLATSAGTHVAIANGKRRGILSDLVAGQFVGTYFPPAPTHRSQRMQWILHGRVSGTRQVVIDDGARDALLHRHKSLLPAGIVRVVGTFKAGDLVDIVDSAGRLIGRGIVNYSSAEIDLIRGHRSADIPKILGAKPYDEAIHRDNLALFEETASTR